MRSLSAEKIPEAVAGFRDFSEKGEQKKAQMVPQSIKTENEPRLSLFNACFNATRDTVPFYDDLHIAEKVN